MVTEFSPNLRQVMLNEMLLLDIHTHEAGTGQSGERPPSDLISRVRGYLEMRLPDIPLRQVIAEECVAFMLNWRENEYLTLQVPAFLLQNNPYVKERATFFHQKITGTIGFDHYFVTLCETSQCSGGHCE